MVTKPHSTAGFTILELLVAISLSTIMMGGVAFKFTEIANPAEHGATSIASFLEMSRAKAISSTKVIIVRPTTVQSLQGYSASSCSDASPTADHDLSLILDDDFGITDLTWEICFSPRGFADASNSIPISDQLNVEKQIQVFIGGGIRII